MSAPAVSRRSRPLSRSADLSAALRGLKLRTLLAAAAMLALAVAAALALRGPLDELLSRLASAGQVPAHMPLPAQPGGGASIAVLVLGGLALAALAGLSWGAFGLLPIRWVMVPVLAPALLLMLLSPRETPWLGLSAIERAIQRSERSSVEAALAKQPELLRHYGLAQVALRTGDAAALRTHGTAVLAAADELAYGLAPQGGRGVELLQPAVIHAIDVALHGQPLTEVGIAWEQRPGWWSRGDSWRMLFRVAAGGALLAAAFAALRVWDLMRRRVRSIGLEAAATPAEPLNPPLPPIAWGWILRAVAVCAVPVMLLRLLSLGLERL